MNPLITPRTFLRPLMRCDGAEIPPPLPPACLPTLRHARPPIGRPRRSRSARRQAPDLAPSRRLLVETAGCVARTGSLEGQAVKFAPIETQWVRRSRNVGGGGGGGAADGTSWNASHVTCPVLARGILSQA
ncbi:hypothetical protein JZ751_013187 [Albula glossodonta]|uniref:Uncharacterized protein n=1 Tax=Albula glossodonta TaxID=121402 RepID=A0A8T2NWC1_9TELE|nr:hypothetical protein JZ751_013187 [Albula glossodonta]